MTAPTNSAPKAETAPQPGQSDTWSEEWGSTTVLEGYQFIPPEAQNSRFSGDSAHPIQAPSRLWRQLMRARVLIAALLLLLQVVLLQQHKTQAWLALLCLGYLLATGMVLRWGQPKPAESAWSPRWGLTLWLDLALFSVLHLSQPGSVNYTPLFAIPVLLAAILGPLLLALGSAAAATLVFLWDAWSTASVFPELATPRYIQAALSGSGLFAVALLANQLALRLVREQAQALHSQALARTEADISNLIVGGLKEGVLVFSAQGTLWHANPAACTILGMHGNTPPAQLLPQAPGWPALAAWVHHCQRTARNASGEISLPTPSGQTRKLLVRATLLHPQTHTRMVVSPCVVFLEDLRDIEARIRTEKLAAMGRISAAVAHEIRNPLAAIAQANALLDEDTTDPAQKRLTHMIGQNAKRLGRTVDDILSTVRHPATTTTEAGPHLPLDDTTQQVLAHWQQLHPQGNRLLFRPGAAQTHVVFDPEHLQRVLVNLLDNAHRHAAQTPQAIHVSTTANATSAHLTVWSQGPELPEQVQQHLFEPFMSSNSRSSGLGLYLSQELCARYGAKLAYLRAEIDERGGNTFTVNFMHQHAKALGDAHPNSGWP